MHPEAGASYRVRKKKERKYVNVWEPRLGLRRRRLKTNLFFLLLICNLYTILIYTAHLPAYCTVSSDLS